MENLNLNEKSLIHFAKQYKLHKKISFFAEIASTNEQAKQICAQGKGRGAVIVADCQTEGRGRLGRGFVSPKGKGIYFTVGYDLGEKENCRVDLISSAAGLAVRDTLYNFFGIDVKIKWPNDILVDDKKLCGILCEIINENNRPKYAVIGIGLNLEKQEFEDELAYTATSVGNVYSGEVELDHNEICIDIVNNLDRYIIRNGILKGEDQSELISRLKAHSATVGRMVRVIGTDEEYDARALDIDENGALVVQGPVEVKTVSSGEIVHLR
ncbi:MAG: biotin--[Clostridia bacterium]|nr:biotin--[acetyl-CoA-carboxylase] ligase [Clostridia bacterium]